MNIITKLHTSFKNICETSYKPAYRVLNFEKNKQLEYIALIQVRNKNITFHMKPEDILANDSLVNQFSPTDIRALTYIGYLGINSPKYKILANQLSQIDQRFSFILKQKGRKKTLTKTTHEILNDEDFIKNLPPKDAQLIGYATATEDYLSEKNRKEKALEKAKVTRCKN